VEKDQDVAVYYTIISVFYGNTKTHRKERREERGGEWYDMLVL
jgi:hypothetical protein